MGHLVRLPGAVVHLPALAAEHGRRLVCAVFVFLAAAVSIGIITAVAYGTNHLLVVPSLGPTAFLIFNRLRSPDPATSCSATSWEPSPVTCPSCAAAWRMLPPWCRAA